MLGMRLEERLAQPGALVRAERGQGLLEVRFILGAPSPGFVEQLDLGDEVGDAVWSAVPDGRHGTTNGWHAAKEPLVIKGIGNHELERPGLCRSGATPDVVDRLV